MRAYANTKQNKVLTAEKLIGFAETMMPTLFEQSKVVGRHLTRTNDENGFKLRHDAPIIPTEIL